ncbi:hypothetical protein B0A53_02063 [Rhodotorula sp. CCFEE 5036]|nr:hypothetical protein B0A53_02063 [Rhodotorula sp. CCFEE 5036]
MPATPTRTQRDGDADNDDDQDDDDEYTVRAAAQTTPKQGVASPAAGSSHTTARTRTGTDVPTTPTTISSSSRSEHSSSPSPLRRSDRGPRGELLHTPPVLLPSLSFNSTARASSPITTSTRSSPRYGWQDGGGRAQSPSTQQQQQPIRDSMNADGDRLATGNPSARDRDSESDRDRERETTAIPSSHPLTSTNSTDSTFSSASSSSSASASASSDNDWARSWIDADHDHDLDRAYEQQQQQQRGFNSNWGLAAAPSSFDPLVSGARREADTTTTTTSSRHSDLAPRAREPVEKGEEEEEEGGERRRRLERDEVQEEGAGARDQQEARTADTVTGTLSAQEEQEQELGRLLRGHNNDDAAEEADGLEEDLADLTPMIGSGFGSPPPRSPPAMRPDDVLATGATVPSSSSSSSSSSSRPATKSTTVTLPTIEPLFSNHRTRRPTSPSTAAAAAATATVTDESDSSFAAAGLGAVPSRPEEAVTAVPSSSSRPLSEFDWAAAYADGEGGAAAVSTTPPAAAAAAAVEAKLSADATPERGKATEASSDLAAPTLTAVSSKLDLEPPPPHGENAIRDEAALLDPLPPQQQEEEQDPMAMLDSLIYQSTSAGEAEMMDSTAAPAGLSTRQSRLESSPSSGVPNPILLPGSVVAATPLSPTSPTANANGNARKERGPAPDIPVKSSRRASLLGRRRQSADSQTLLQRAASMAMATSSRSTVGGGTATAMTADPSSSSSLNEAGGRARTGSSPSHARRSGSVPASAPATSPGPASGLSSPSGAATSPTLSRNSSSYDFAEIADVYARNSLYYPPPDATPRASRAWESEEVPRPTSASFEEETGSGTNTARQSRIEEQLEPTSAVEPPARAPSSSTLTPSRSSTDVSRADAKARAAAFIEDLKRAKANEAITAAPGAPVIAAGFETARRAPHLADEYSFSMNGSSTASAVQSYSMPAETSPDTTPPLPPPSSSKRPLENASASSSFGSRRQSYDTTSRSTPNLALLSSSRRPSEPTLASLGPEQPLLDQRPPLLRRRALPTAVIISAELKKAATSRERCRLYVDKLNELGRERSRLDEWILATKGDHWTPDMSAANSPKRSRRARQDASVATFAPRGDGYRAREITRGSFSAHDLAPSAPFPGVLNLPPTRSTSHASLSSGGGGGGGGKSFFSGLGRGTLGRRMSKRDHAGGPSSSRSSAKSSSLRSTISGPVQVLSSTNAALATISDGPYRPPAHQAAYTTRNSFDSRRSSPATSPQASRASFSYGSLPPSASSVSSPSADVAAPAPAIPTFQVTRGSVYYENGEKTAGSQVGDLDEDKLDRLADVLPQASRADLAAALEEAGGDDVLAISVYLSSEPSLT